MTRYLGPEVLLVLPLHLGHRQQAIEELEVAARAGVDGRVLVLDDVAALEPPGRVHGQEPASRVAERAQGSADRPEDGLPTRLRLCPEVTEDPRDEAAVVPLLVLDLVDALALLGIAHRAPMAAVGISGGQLPGVGELELGHEQLVGIHPEADCTPGWTAHSGARGCGIG